MVYNPNGAFLPPNQEKLEQDYHRLLGDNFGIVFNRLYALANMPIQRFGSWLVSKGQFQTYMATLRQAHRDENLDSVMCRSTLSVGYDGYLYDCDFNQMLKLPLAGREQPTHLRDFLRWRGSSRDRRGGTLLRLHRRPGFQLRRSFVMSVQPGSCSAVNVLFLCTHNSAQHLG